MHLYEKKLNSKLIYSGRVVKLYSDDVILENGEKTIREVIRHPGGVCVAAITDDDCVFVVKQFRYPQNRVLTELPAGKLEWNENPLDCGKRELLEETGYVAENYTYLGKLLPTPAYDDEVIYIYMATDLTSKKQDLDDNEFLDVEKIPLNEVLNMIMTGEISDAKTQVAILKIFAARTGNFIKI